MPRAFLITNKRYRPGIRLPTDAKETAIKESISINNDPDVKDDLPSPSASPSPPVTPPSPVTSPSAIPGNAPFNPPFLPPPGGLDCTLSPSKASIPSLSPCKPDSPTHSSRVLYTPPNLAPPHPLLFSPLKREPPRIPFPLPKWPTAFNPLFGLTELSDLHQTTLIPASNVSPPFMESRMNHFVWSSSPDIPLPGQIEEHHPCPDCGKAYSTSSNLARHRQTHRSISDKKARKCPHCDKVYVSMPAYSMHVRTHSQGCQCPYCGKRFSRPWLLQGHIRTHTGEKPFTCQQCGKAFADKSNLRAHVQTHSTEKPYSCGRCGKAFALKSYLYKHEESSCMRGQRLHGRTPAFR